MSANVRSKKASIIDEDDNKIGEVDVPTDEVGLMSKRIMIGLQVYESQLDDFCCFKGYMAVPVTRIDLNSVKWVKGAAPNES